MKNNKIVVLKNDNGYTFLLVFFTIILISVLGLSILKVSSNTLKTSDHERDDQSVYYIAEAGLNYGREHFKTAKDLAKEKYDEQKRLYEQKLIPDPPDLEAFLKTELVNLGYPIQAADVGIEIALDDSRFENFETPTFDDQFGHTPKVNIFITLNNATSLQYTIKSTGEFEGTSIQRTLQQNVTAVLEVTSEGSNDGTTGGSSDGTTGGSGGGSTSDGHFIPNEYTVQTKGNIIVNAGGTINGNVASAGGTITLKGGASINGTIGTSPDKFNVDNDGLNKYKDQVTDSKDFPSGNVLAPFPDDRMNTLSQLSYPPNQEA